MLITYVLLEKYTIIDVSFFTVTTDMTLNQLANKQCHTNCDTLGEDVCKLLPTELCSVLNGSLERRKEEVGGIGRQEGKYL